MKKLMGDQDHIRENLLAYVQALLARRARHLRALRVPHPDRPARQGRPALPGHREVRQHRPAPRQRSATRRWALVFEELIRKFAELSNETAGEHFTPREVIRLMVNLLFIEDDDALTKPGVVRSHLRPDRRHRRHAVASPASTSPSMNPQARLVMYGQELNPESYAICKADMLIKGQDVANIVFGNTLSDDGLPGKQFDYMLSNPPFGVEWKKIEKEVRKEHEQQGFNGRFGPGLPRVSATARCCSCCT